MAFALDTSVTICWAMTDEVHITAATARELIRTQDAHVPDL